MILISHSLAQRDAQGSAHRTGYLLIKNIANICDGVCTQCTHKELAADERTKQVLAYRVSMLDAASGKVRTELIPS
jgi:hypothetical protein